MKRNDKIATIVEIILFIIVAIVIIAFTNDATTFKEIIYGTSLVTLAIFYHFSFGHKKINKTKEKLSIKSLLIALTSIAIICYGLGLILGFSRTFFPLTLQKLSLSVIPIIITIISTEFFRNSFLRSINNEKKHYIILTIELIIFESLSTVTINNFSSGEGTFVTICTFILPVCASQILKTYLSINIGIKPAIIYSLITNLYLFIIPIEPKLGNYLYSVIWIIIPLFTYYLTKKSLQNSFLYKEDDNNSVKKGRALYIAALPTAIIIFLLIMVILVSGIFRYKMIAIATNSMYPVFQKGDAIIYDQEASVEIGDVAVFNGDKKIVTHRVVDITKRTNQETEYQTKGDANNDKDSPTIKESAILGKAQYVIKYIGYPTIWFNELIERINE